MWTFMIIYELISSCVLLNVLENDGKLGLKWLNHQKKGNQMGDNQYMLFYKPLLRDPKEYLDLETESNMQPLDL